MSKLTSLFDSFSDVSDQTSHCNDEQSIIVPFIRSFFDDNPLLPRQSRITRFISEKMNSQSWKDKQLFRIHYKIHHGFTPTEEIFIKNALEIIENRLFQPEILQNMHNICGTSGSLYAAGVWSRSQLANDQNYHGVHDLLRFQLMCLRFNSENGQFPTIHLYPMYEKTDTQSEGTIGCISCISHGSTFSIKGKFKVKLNRYNLDAYNENIANTIYWAGAIVHEMLHNLGHKHRVNDYSDSWQINVFEKCVLYNGNYAP